MHDASPAIYSFSDPQSFLHPLQRLRARRPLILCVTNYVTMDFCANALLAIGAAPVMSLDAREISELVRAASAVYINMGTIHSRWTEAATIACSEARTQRKPVVFDPVGAGATTLRTETARALIREFGVDAVRGNASEIQALTCDQWTTKGVDTDVDASQIVKNICGAQYAERTLVVSGVTDYILGPGGKFTVTNGSPEMSRVTGMGCVASALIAAFQAVEDNSILASMCGMAVMGLCGERAAEKCHGSGSFRTAFLDELSRDDIPFSRLNVGVL